MISSLLQRPPLSWVVKTVIPRDWHDGALSGICILADPAVIFYFSVIDERYNPDDVDDRIYRVYEIDIPIEEASTLDHGLHGDKIEEAINNARPTKIVIFTRGMGRVLGCWSVADDAFHSTTNWFAFLGI